MNSHRKPAWSTIGMTLIMLLPGGLVGCSKMHVESVARSSFRIKGRVAILGQLTRVQEELFTPLYMKAFAHQALVERRDIDRIIGEQDLSPDRLREETRAKIRRILGVTAIVYPNYTETNPGQLSIKVIDTETGEIVAAILVTKIQPWLGPKATDRLMIYKGIDALRRQTRRIANDSTWHLK